jgi:hypothetical protein
MPMSGTSAPLEAALDELYGVEASEFVAARKRLASDLRGAGDAAAAKTLLAARRPTTAAWALNQLVRREPALVETFLERSQDLEAAQMGELEGGRDAIREATRAQRDALGAATDAAMAALGDRATDTYRSQVQATLHAASADPSAGEQLRRGRFVRELSGATGFSGFPGLSLVPDLEPHDEPQPRAAPKPKAASKSDRAATQQAERAAEAERRRVETERAAAEAAAQRLEAAEHEAQAAQEEADAADAAAAEIHQRIDALTRDLDAARRTARVADERVARSAREAVRLARAATKLRSRSPASREPGEPGGNR